MRAGSSPRLRWWVYALVFAVALIGFIKRGEFSPLVQIDTSFEEALVHECLRGEGCTTLGGSASFRDVYHMVGWLNFMVLAEWLGLGRDAIHLLIQLANAVRIVLVMLVAERLGGAPAATLAPFFAFQSAAAPGVLYDTSLMAFFGTVLLLQCVAAAIERPPTKLIVLAALVAAVIAEVHVAGAMALLSVVWVTVLHPPDRMRRVAIATVAFVAAVLIISPMGIAWDLGQLIARLTAAPEGSRHSAVPLLARLSEATDTLAFLVPWLLYRFGRPWLGQPPPGLRGALAICVPIAGACALGVLLGVFSPTSSHYLEHAYPAKAVVLAVPLAAIGTALWGLIAPRLAVPASVRGAVLWAVPLVLSLHAAWAQQPWPRVQPRWADVQALARLLHDDWQWDWLTVDREVRSPEKALLLDDLSAAVPGWKSADRMAARRPAEPLAVIAVDREQVPDPLPSGWIPVSRRTFQTLLAIPMRSSLDWNDQAICVEDQHGHETCVGPPIDPKQLADLRAQVPEMRRWVRRVRWRGGDGAVESIVMPNIPLTCPGRIVQGPPGTQIDAGGRHARLTTAGEVVFEWSPNTPSCPVWDFLKLDDPPFVITGDPKTVEAMARIIQENDI